MTNILRFTSLGTIALFAFVACAAPGSEEPQDGGDEFAADEQDLSARSQKYVGNYFASEQPVEGKGVKEFGKLNLDADGTFYAETLFSTVNPGTKVACLSGPCTKPEEGKFRVVRSNGRDVLVLDPKGPNNARRYTVSFNSDETQVNFVRGSKRFTLTKYNPCMAVRCTALTECVAHPDGTAGCEPVLHPECASMTCAPGSKCIPNPSDPAHATCAASCQVIRCAANHECVDPINEPAYCEKVLPAACAFTTCSPGSACVAKPSSRTGEVQCVATCQVMECMPGKRCVDSDNGASCK
jgi:hypothetical protein